MQSVMLNIEESFMQDFLRIIAPYGDRVRIQKDSNLEYDPYFYERQKELHQIREDIKSGKIEMIEDDAFWEDI
ncbi:MAG: hypothetical protein JXQ76_01670, partial [Campylobacterales bacterium]|nr:hypothetical protein [Campylobacterales bacterium]